MTWQLATAKIWNGSQWVNAAGGADVYSATDGTDAPYATSNVTVTASSTTHTKGAWIEVVASAGFTVDRLILQCGANSLSNTNSSTLLDIGTGAAGSETVIVANLAVGYTRNGTSYDIPVRIASGTRIAFRMQSAISSRTMTANVILCRAASTLTVAPSTSVNTFGANTTTSAGVTVTSGNNVKGSWTQITSNAGSAAKYLLIGVQGNSSSGMSNNNMLLDVGVGAAGAETAIVTNYRLAPNAVELIDYTSVFRGYFVTIPASSRLSVRTQATSATISLDVILYTVNEVGSR